MSRKSAVPQGDKKTLAHLRPEQRLAAARAAHAKFLPYFESSVLSLVPYEVPGLGTLGVTADSILVIDSEVFCQWTADEAGAVVGHEWLHIYLQHEKRFQALVASGVLTIDPNLPDDIRDQPDRMLWNDAADMEDNGILLEVGMPLPSITQKDGSVSTPVTAESAKFPKGLTAEQYLHLMLEQRKNGGRGPRGVASGNHPGCGTGSGGNALPGEPDKGTPLGREPIEQEMQRIQASQGIVAAAKKSIGSVPGQLLRIAERDIPDARVRWEDELLSEVTNSIEYLSGTGDYTWEIRSPHQAALELQMDEDAPVLPGEHQPTVEVAGVIDTSGSMGEDELTLATGEVKGILDAVGGANITFMAIDCKVQELARVNSVQEVLALLKGGGGTDFKPAFSHLFRKADPKPNIVVYVTDGWGDAPKEQPEWLDKAIWVITPGGRRCSIWGKTIYMDGKPSEEGMPEFTGKTLAEEDDDADEDDGPDLDDDDD
jgi:predicted metal-dependent peptidase